MKLTNRELAQSAVFSALLCIASVITIPLGVVPVTLGIFGVMMVSVILGAKRALIAVLIFILAGILGLPVFRGFSSGFGVIAGPTGGYITSYIFVALIIGKTADKSKNNIWGLLSCFAGLIICYLFGSIQYMIVSGITFKTALLQSVLIFVPTDIIKAFCAAFLGIRVRKRLMR